MSEHKAQEREKKKNGTLLLTRFPLESAWGGEEEIHLLMAKILRDEGRGVELLTSCPFLSDAFRKNDFSVHREFEKDITSKSRILWSVILVPFFFFRGILWLGYYRFFRRVDTVLFLTFIEKVVWTPLALLFRMNVFWGHHAPFGDWLFKNPYFFLWRWFSGRVKIIVTTEFMKNELIPYVRAKENIIVHPNTLIPEKDFSTMNDKKWNRDSLLKMMREKTGKNIDTNSFLIGSLGRLSREKGTIDLLKASSEIRKSHPEAVIVIGGSGPEEQSLRAFIISGKLGSHVFLLGFLKEEELPEFYGGIDLFVLPSLREPFGMVLLEAMSAGTPIVARRVGGVPEVVGEKYSGLFYGNDSAMADALRRFIEDPELRTRESEYVSRRFQEMFSFETYRRKTLDTFSSPCCIKK